MVFASSFHMHFVSSVCPASVKFLALRLCSIILFVKRTIISIISSEESNKNTFNSLFVLLAEPTGVILCVTIFTDVWCCNLLLEGFSASQVVLHILCFPLEGPSPFSRLFSFSISWLLSPYLARNQSNISLNLYYKSLQAHQDLHLLADNFQKFDCLLDTSYQSKINSNMEIDKLVYLWIYPKRYLLLQSKQLTHKNVWNLLRFYNKDNSILYRFGGSFKEFQQVKTGWDV